MKKLLIALSTKSRPETLKKFLKRYGTGKWPLTTTIEQSELKLYREVLKPYSNINIIPLKNNQGLAYSRKKLALYSVILGYKYTLFVDDNSYFHYEKIDQALDVLDIAPTVKWMGACNPYYKLVHKNESKPNLYPANHAASVFFIRNSCFKKVNFDPQFYYQEDLDLNLSLKETYYPDYPIYVYKPFTFSKKRHEAGGTSTYKNPRDLKEIVKRMNTKHKFEVMKNVIDKNDNFMRWSQFHKSLGGFPCLKK